ncbi:MAG: glycosyltransferase, partial [Acidobacteria bacterium]|nr:glycosyltransferase [Acidobacteriota bacterium]
MPKEIILSPEVLPKLEKVKEADIVIGIPSYNNARTIGQVIRTVDEGLAKYFPDCRSLIVNSDGGSRDETAAVAKACLTEDPRLIALAHSLHPVYKIITPYHGMPGKGSAFRTIFQIAESLGAKACAVVDASLTSITPEWIEQLVKPVLSEGFDYVSPVYFRHKYDGTITNSIVYPLTRALYGKRIRQPIGSDCGFSGQLVSFYLAEEVWHTSLARYGIEIWMATAALAGGFKICQAFLGAKVHDGADPVKDLSAMVTQVVGTVFHLMEAHQGAWLPVNGSEPIPIFGLPLEVGLEPVDVRLERLVNAYRQGVRDLSDIWKNFLPVPVMEGLERLSKANLPEFRFQDALWAKVVFEFAAAHFTKRMDREHLLKSMTPL